MWQSQACWLYFSADYRFLVKVGGGSINAITGKSWSAAPDFEEEDYIEVPNQPWLDGFCVERGNARQFVAMPLHAGYTVEEQVSPGEALGGVRLVVVPLKAAIYEQRKADGLRAGPPEALMGALPDVAGAGMGLGAGGEIRQSIETPVESPENWALQTSASAWVHVANSLAWQQLTGERPPMLPPSAADYTAYGLPWFDWYDDTFARSGSNILARRRVSIRWVANGRSLRCRRMNRSLRPNRFDWVTHATKSLDGRPRESPGGQRTFGWR
jgi:hypothetical protein